MMWHKSITDPEQRDLDDYEKYLRGDSETELFAKMLSPRPITLQVQRPSKETMEECTEKREQ